MKSILEKNKLNIIIASNEDIEYLIKTSNSIERVKYLRYQEVIDDFLGKYSLDAFLDLNFSKGLTFSNAKILLNNSLLLEKENKEESLSSLMTIKEKYDDFIYFDNLKKEIYKGANIILYNYYATDDFFYKALQKIESSFRITKYFYKRNLNSTIYFNEYENINNEIKALTYKVGKLLNEGILSEDIVIINNNSEYDSLLRAYFNLANISLSDEAVPLIHFEFVKKIIEAVFDLEDDDLINSFNVIVKSLSKLTNNEAKLLKEVNKVFLQLLKINQIKENLKDLVIYLLTNKTIVLNKYTNVIQIERNLVSSYKYVFMIGMSDDKCSYKYKNNEYISDDLKLKLNLLTSYQKNLEYEKKIKNYIDSLDNVFISYSKNTEAGPKQKPALLNLFKFFEYRCNDNITYSKNIDELRYKILLDQYIKYREESSELYDLAGNYQDIAKQKYNNNFTGINKDLNNKYLNSNISLSYTSIDEYYNCAFKFYLKRILRISKISNEDPLIIGNIFHKVLAHINEEKIDYDFYINEYLEKENIIPAGYLKHFINKYKVHFQILLPYIKDFHKNSQFESSFLEKRFETIIDMENNIRLQGVIDKVMVYDYLNKKYFLVIDYKTGNAKSDFKNLFYGLDMQLLIYFYLLSKEYPNYGFGGSYLQKLIPTSLPPFSGKNYDDEFRKYLSLDGYSNTDYIILNAICENIEDGVFVNGIKFLKGSSELQSYSKSRTFSEDEFKKLLEITENKVLNAKEQILKAKYDINPKKGKGIDSCQYCPYKDICYKTESDYEKLPEIKDYSFLEDK